MMSNSEARKRQVPAPAPSALTDAEREGLADYLPFPVRHDDWAILMSAVERILAARLAEQREQIAEALSNEPADRATWDDGTEFIAVDSALRIVREWGIR